MNRFLRTVLLVCAFACMTFHSLPAIALVSVGGCPAGHTMGPDGICTVDTTTVVGGGGGGGGWYFPGSGGGNYTHYETGGGWGGGGRQGGQTDGANRNADSTICPIKSNPIVISTGNKIEPETDFVGSGEMGLLLKRTYNKYWTGIGLFGKQWLSNLDYKLTFGSSVVNTCYPRPGGGACAIGSNTAVWALRPDGRQIKYTKSTDGVFRETKASPIARIVRQANGTFILYGEDNSVEVYTASGYVSQVKNEQGIGWTFAYNGTYLTKITHTSGRYVSLVWTGNRLTSVRDPAGNYYGYSYLENKFGTGLHLLAASSRPGLEDTTTSYHYEDSRFPGALTGKSINGVRFSKFTYDANGYATSSEHGGAEKSTFAYTAGSNGLLTVVETNPLGKQATYVFKDGKSQSVSGHASSHCSAANASTQYDTNGYPQTEVGFNGSTTNKTYNAKGQVTKIVEGYGTAAARETQYTWDATRNRVTAITLVGQLRTEYTFTADNRVATIKKTNLSANGVTGQTRTTTFTYTKYASGIVSKIVQDGPIAGVADAISTTYNTLGDVTSVSNGLGHVTTYANYNALGLPGKITNPNGGVIDYGYDAQGRLISTVQHVGTQNMLTTWVYDGRGLLVAKTNPDNQTRFYHYDIQRRRVAEFESEKGGTYAYRNYRYDLGSNVLETNNWRIYGAPADPFPYVQPQGGDSDFVSQTVPATLTPGQTVQATVRMLNTGTTTWTNAGAFRLGSQNPGDNTRWNIGRVVMPQSTAPGEVANFVFNIHAPTAPGGYNFQWRMVQESVAWFGQTTPNVVIRVGSPTPPPSDPCLRYCPDPLATTPPMDVPDGVTEQADPDVQSQTVIASQIDTAQEFQEDLMEQMATTDLGPSAEIVEPEAAPPPAEADPDANQTPTSFMVHVEDETTYTPDVATGIDLETAATVGGTSGFLFYRAYIDYDEEGRVRGNRGNNGQNITYTRDGAGRITKVINSAGEPTLLYYDALDRIYKSVDARTGVTLFAYDDADHLIQVTDPRGKVTAYTYDGFGQTWKVISPDAGTTTFTYNASGQMTQLQRPDGRLLTYTYDGLGRAKTESSALETHTYTYDAPCAGGKGRLCSITDRTGSQTYTYTTFGLLASQRQMTSGIALDQTFAYDGLGRLTGTSHNGGVGIGYGYSYGRLAAITTVIGGIAKTVLSNIAYQPFGEAASFEYGNGLARTINHDLDGRLTGLSTKTSGTVVQSLTLGLNAQDEITQITNGVNSALTQGFGYDELSRLTSVVATNANQTLAYDASSNRTSHTWGGATDTYFTQSSSNMLDGIGGTRQKGYGYDFSGNRTDTNGIHYSYDAFNRMEWSLKNAVKTDYGVNALGLRVSKTQGGTSYSQFAYTPSRMMTIELTQGIRTHYIWMGDELVGIVRSGQLYNVHGDQVGRPEIVTNASKAVVWRANNYAFDRAVTLNSIGGLNLGLPGQYYDSETDLWNNGFRDYDAKTGRYLQSDPLGLSGGVNTYAYAASNPVSRIDPLGLKDYDACETRSELNKVVKQLNVVPQLPLNTARLGVVAYNHSEGGQFDYKIRQPTDTFMISGVRYSAAAFGNFAAGYMAAWFDTKGFGYSAVRQAGVYYDYIDGNSDGDLDSISDIDAGFAMGNGERDSGQINDCGCGAEK